MNKKFVVLVVALVIIFFIKNVLEYSAIKPFLEKIKEYQQNIKPEMIISIIPYDRYTGKPIVDWKLDELALAMANVQARVLNHPSGFLGSLTIEMDTTGTEIRSDVLLTLAHENGERFIGYFRLSIMRDGEWFVRETFVGEELSEWARSVGIANKEDWSYRPLEKSSK